MRFKEFSVLTEAASRIQHAEDLIFWHGSKGAIQAIQGLVSLETEGHKKVSLKVDGSPSVIFGRDETGQFIFTDKSGFSAKGYDGKAKSKDDLHTMLMNRPGAIKNPESYGEFANKMASVFRLFEQAVPKKFVGFFKGDMLYFNTPKIENNEFVFKPNIVEYRVDVNSDIGQRIKKSKTGIVIHNIVDNEGNTFPLTDYNIFEGTNVLVIPPVIIQEPVKIDDSITKKLRVLVSKYASQIDSLLDETTLTALKIKDLPQVFYTYINHKVDTGLDNLGGDFINWLQSSKVSKPKQQRIAQHISENISGFNHLWEIVLGIIKLKNNIIDQLENQNLPIKQYMNGEKGGEGFVLAGTDNDIKLVNRDTFTRLNRSVER